MKRSLILAVSVVMIFAVQVVGVEAQSKPKAMSAVGAVKSVSADSLVVTVGAKDMTFTLDNTTKFVGKGLSTKSGGAPMKATDAVAPVGGEFPIVPQTRLKGTRHCGDPARPKSVSPPKCESGTSTRVAFNRSTPREVRTWPLSAGVARAVMPRSASDTAHDSGAASDTH